MAYFHKRGSRSPMAEINVVPFIDVMLVLLVIFMITTPLLTQGVKVDLPKTTSNPLNSDQKDPIIVTVDTTGNYYLNLADKPNQPLSARALSHLLSEQFHMSSQTTDNPRPILVRGDKNTSYGKVIEAMALLQQAGANSIGLITQPKPDQQD